MAPGLGQLKPNTTRSSHRGRPASTFPLISNIIYIPSLGVKFQTDAHYTPVKDNFPLRSNVNYLLLFMGNKRLWGSCIFVVLFFGVNSMGGMSWSTCETGWG